MNVVFESDQDIERQATNLWLAGGVTSVSAGVFSLLGGARGSYALGSLAIAQMVAAGAIKVFVAQTPPLKITVNTSTDALDALFSEATGTPLLGALSSNASSLHALAAALYNKCCFEVFDPQCGTKYQTGGGNCSEPFYNEGVGLVLEPSDPLVLRDNQLPVLNCNDASACTTSRYPPIIDTLTGTIPTLPETFCSCYNSQVEYDAIVAAIDAAETCSALSNAVIRNASSIEIPGSGLQFGDLPALMSTVRVALGGASAIEEFAVVGKIYPPESVFGEAAESIGWSCGLGYAKVLGFSTQLILQQEAEAQSLEFVQSLVADQDIQNDQFKSYAYVFAAADVLCVVIVLSYWAFVSFRQQVAANAYEP